MQGLYQLNATITHFLEGFLETAVPMIAGLAEVVGLFIIITSLAKASYHYVRATFFNDHHDFHHEMSSGLTTALEFLMSAEIAKTFLLPMPRAKRLEKRNNGKKHLPNFCSAGDIDVVKNVKP